MKRFKVVQTFLLSGTPLSRMPYFRSLLESDLGVALPNESHLSAVYIPRIEEAEFSLLRQELRGQWIGISFDGTSRLGEAINITGRWCTDDFNLQKRLLRFITAKTHVNSEELASTITCVLCTELAIPPQLVRCTRMIRYTAWQSLAPPVDCLIPASSQRQVGCISRDSVAVNGAACRMLTQAPFSTAEDMMCISHTLNNVGSRISFDVLEEFMGPWLELVGGRNPHRGAQSLWRAKVAPQKVPGFSNVRWFCKAEIQFVLAENFEKLQPFLLELDARGYGDATRQKLHDILDADARRHRLKLQLAAMLDLRDLVRYTYQLEGDGLELLILYERIEHLRAIGRVIAAGGEGVLPNVDAVLRKNVKLRNGLKIQKV